MYHILIESTKIGKNTILGQNALDKTFLVEYFCNTLEDIKFFCLRPRNSKSICSKAIYSKNPNIYLFIFLILFIISFKFDKKSTNIYRNEMKKNGNKPNWWISTGTFRTNGFGRNGFRILRSPLSTDHQ